MLGPYRATSPIVLGLPRGGVPVAYEVARALGAPLDVWVSRKIGAPFQPELGVGAVAEGGVVYLNEDLLRQLGLHEPDLAATIERETREVARRAERFRRGGPAPNLHGRVVVLVDDGIATGGTARAAIRGIRAQAPQEIVLCAPVGAVQTIRDLRPEVDNVACLEPTPTLRAIGPWYDDFSQVSDAEVMAFLDAARVGSAGSGSHAEDVRIPIGGRVALSGTLHVPGGANGIVAFAHGSGSSRYSPRNQQVAATLVEAGMGTLLLDLLTPDEEEAERHTRHLRFNIGLLADRLLSAARWLEGQPLPIGYFGASTGAAAALVAAARQPEGIVAVVCRGGRPDLAEDYLAQVRAPTLLIVGGDDTEVLELNERAYRLLRCEKRLEVIAGATHLFEEPGCLDQVAALAKTWFARAFAAAAVPVSHAQAHR